MKEKLVKKILATAAAALLGFGLISIAATSAQGTDTTPYTVQFTGGLGAYPRSAPEHGARTGTAVAEGTVIDATCWLNGGDVTNPYDYTSSVWIRDRDGLFWPEAWLETGTFGVPVGLPSCDDAQPAAPEATWQPNCTPGGPYIEGTIEKHESDRGTRISLTPTATAREAWDNNTGWESTVEMWHAIQDCVPDLYDGTADSVWQQLECHQRYATVRWPHNGEYATGPTYDLEAWTDPLAMPNDFTYLLSRCLGYDYLAPMRLFAMTDM